MNSRWRWVEDIRNKWCWLSVDALINMTEVIWKQTKLDMNFFSFHQWISVGGNLLYNMPLTATNTANEISGSLYRTTNFRMYYGYFFVQTIR